MKHNRRRHVWIVEMKNRAKWLTTVGCGINRKYATSVLGDWRENNPGSTFRLVKYISTQP